MLHSCNTVHSMHYLSIATLISALDLYNNTLCLHLTYRYIKFNHAMQIQQQPLINACVK